MKLDTWKNTELLIEEAKLRKKGMQWKKTQSDKKVFLINKVSLVCESCRK